jgi:cation:H+ antiporter
MMAPTIAVSLLLGSSAVTLSSAATFARRLDRLGARFGLPEVLIGLLTAVAADGPEVSSAIVALFKGAHQAGVGVIVGSNLFNLAAMVGVSAVLVGRVRVTRKTLALEGTVALAVTAIVIVLLLGRLSAGFAIALLMCVLVPYLAIVIAGSRVRERLPAFVADVIEHTVEEGEHRAPAHSGVHLATRRQALLMAGDVLLVVAGSFGMVQAALSLGDAWGIRPALIGSLVLGPLTSLPNALTGVRLGIGERGAALITEVLNSNTINLVAGIALPALFVTLTARSGTDRLDLALLAAMTVTTLALLRRPGGLRRVGGMILIAYYVAFVAIQLV